MSIRPAGTRTSSVTPRTPEPPAPKKKTETRNEVSRQQPRQVKDGFDSAQTRGATQAGNVSQVNNDPAYRQALQTQQQLSQLRQEAGKLQLELDNRNPLSKVWDGVTGGDDAKEARVAELRQQITALEQTERSQPADAVERARFTVFTERMASLERELGKSGAATIARQTYYNSPVWNAGAGTSEASQAQIMAAGLPHDPTYIDGLASGGYGGRMRTPDGKEVDMGHVACALDWQVNADRIPSTINLNPIVVPPVLVPNPFNLETVTLTGDVASAVRNTAAGANANTRADTAIGREGNEDWYGDIDGLNLANRLRQNPNASIADTLNGYYSTGQYQNRMDEFATHSRHIVRDQNGVPQRDENGHYKVDRDTLSREAYAFSIILNPKSINNPAGEVTDAWTRWFNQEQDAARGRR